ncbi:hypothetical protein HanRHA438_Chr17g0826481 [Helianthus annuus]|uniref:Uncharacterized protein n=1 Tax=Helianthus annuus TaxID=4232 RepID=A0A9K3DJF7_HELAN|nr:uncharacterized protein LOC110926360 [Helianthus annuus]KAF5756569.1 hypothetical protein HanXRQr2_Chr17g0816241 [Helianthus annuus]KAJ0430063.1 hypothetical protein HanHA300_Chr17g0664621 [Helianthus annuus]KAJ0434800.1 hypothetical protein HanIR_Chr17g0885871 [Helianthus annuus]KAJ0448495.1 hypothetical protein HanHA89_Chr17g0717511 [Helianthus annuus]KAJ0637171.1 hypothetical protein HanOQP8_Chr17g0670621 [Helianthus annuus]
MSDAYERVKGGRLTFKGGTLASTSKSIDKKKKKKKNHNKPSADFTQEILTGDAATAVAEHGGAPSAADAGAKGPDDDDIYTIDAAKKMKYDDLFPVEAKKFGYDPKAKVKSVEDALDDRVKKKADRYCK